MSEHALLHRRRVPAPLVGLVSSLTGYDVAAAPGLHRGLPTTGLTFVLPVDEPIDVGWADDPASRSQRWSCLSGLHTRPAEIRHFGLQRGLQLALTPAGARALLGLPAAALAAELVLVDEAVPELAELPELLAGCGDWAARFAVVEAALLDALARRGGVRPSAAVARALVLLAAGQPVAAVADEVGYSRRRLSDLVRAECGLTPKAYARVARFERSRGLLVSAAGAGRSLAEVAAEGGYADQAHLTREWTSLAGCSPTRWLAEEFPFLQESGALDAAS